MRAWRINSLKGRFKEFEGSISNWINLSFFKSILSKNMWKFSSFFLPSEPPLPSKFSNKNLRVKFWQLYKLKRKEKTDSYIITVFRFMKIERFFFKPPLISLRFQNIHPIIIYLNVHLVDNNLYNRFWVFRTKLVIIKSNY